MIDLLETIRNLITIGALSSIVTSLMGALIVYSYYKLKNIGQN